MSMLGKSFMPSRHVFLFNVSSASVITLIFSLNTALAQNAVEVVRLGQPDVQIGSRYVGRQNVAIAASDVFSAVNTAKTMLLKQMQISSRPTAIQWNQAEALGLSQEPALVIRGKLNPTEEWAIAAKSADVWFTLKPTLEGDYDLEGAFDLETIANNGLLTESLATLAITMTSSDDEKQAIHGLWQTSNQRKLATAAALLQLDAKNTNEDIELTTTFRVSRMGVIVETQTHGFWDDLWGGIKDTANCYLAAIGDFVEAHDEIEWEISFGTDGVNVTFKGKVSGKAAGKLMKEMKICVSA